MLFHSVEAHEAFILAFQASQDQGIILMDYGVAENEWAADGSYPENEIIPIGCGVREYNIHLPFQSWWPQAVLWAQSTDAMTTIHIIKKGEL
ncbi:hypothetical protein J3R82DRAFT_10197 [Butyriboletus roseoflavus]|nr:hypothetical protein J3R82DRAFT_10197 [Butyriboletus roseoflavus]